MKVAFVGVVGAGVMGRGVAQGLAQTGHRVVLVDLSKEVLDEARREIRRNVRLQALLEGSQGPESEETILGRIQFATGVQELSKVDFVIENVPEKWSIKKEVFVQLDEICSGRCILASNTSAIPISQLASLTERPMQVIGTHFMNPVPLIPMVEVVRGSQTSDQTVETTRCLLAQMGKELVVVGDSPGFVSNRVLMLMINEAIRLVEEQVAAPREIDRIFKGCLGHRMGPLETADLIGLDTILDTLEVLQESLGGKFEPCSLLAGLVDAGCLGRKTGRGLFEYPSIGSKPAP